MSDEVGGIFETRVGLRTRVVAVVGEVRRGLSIILPSGEVRVGPTEKLGNQRRAPALEARSQPGRLYSLLQSTDAQQLLTSDALAAVQQTTDDLLKDPDQAMGLLLDRPTLALDPQRYFELPLERWRVNYELLADGALDDAAKIGYARDLVSDHSAPDEVRLVVAIKHQLSLSDLDPAYDRLLSDTSTLDGQPAGEALNAATSLGRMLERIGFTIGTSLAEAAQNPAQYSTTFPRCAALAVLIGQLPEATPLDIDPRIPVSVIDDLIDRGASLMRPSFDDVTKLPGSPAIPLRTYLAARAQPSDLTNDEVERLGFTAEAYRRVANGDGTLASMLEDDALSNAGAVEALNRKEIPEVEPADGRLKALVAAMKSGTLEGVEPGVLSDVSTWQLLAGLLPPSSKPDTDDAQRLSDLSHLYRARQALFDWRWEDARSIARDGLRWSTNEAVRDESLNVVACSLWLQDDYEPALAALDKALEGEYTDALLTNAAVVASGLDHATAVRHFARLAREAPSSEMKAIAAERALMLWANDDEGLWDDNEDGLPIEIRNALRPLIRQRLPEERYIRVLKALAIHDDEWLAGKHESDFGPNANSHAQRVFQARAAGFDEFARGLAHEFSRGDHPEWVVDERDSIVASAIGVLVDDISHLGAAMCGMALLESRLPIPEDDHVALVCLTVTAITANIDPETGEPKDEFLDWLEVARRKHGRLDATDADRLDRLVEIASEALARSYTAARYHQLDQAIAGYNNVMGSIRGVPQHRLNTAAVANAFRPLSKFCTETDTVLRRVRTMVKDPELIAFIDAVMTDNTDLGHRVARFR